MFSFGFIELFILPFLFGSGFGFPAAMPPADEIPLMSQVAPEECVYFATWPGFTELDPEHNVTERWMAQPELQKFYPLVKQALRELIADVSWHDETEQSVYNLFVEIADAMTTQSCSIFIAKIAEMKDIPSLHGGFLLHLGESKQMISDRLQQFSDQMSKMERKTKPTSVVIEEIEFTIVPFEPSFLVGIHDDFLWIATDEEQMRSMLANAKTAPPSWLQKIRSEIPVERVASLCYVNVKLGLAQTEKFHPRELGLGLSRFGLDSVVSMGMVGGLDQFGFLTRTRIEIESDELPGLFSVFGKQPIELDDLARIDEDSLFSISCRLQPEKVYELIKQFADTAGALEQLETQIAELEENLGITFGDEIIGDLDGLINVYVMGDFPFFNRGLVISLKIKENLTFHDTFHQINQFIEAVALDLEIEIKQEQHGETSVYSVVTEPDEFNPFQLNPTWYFDGNELVLSFNESSIIGHLNRIQDGLGGNATSAETVQQLFTNLSGLPEHPQAIFMLNSPKIIELFYPMLVEMPPPDATLFPNSNLMFGNLPSITVIRNYMQPNSVAIYRVNNGLEMVHRQTLPGGAVGTLPLLITGVFASTFSSPEMAMSETNNARMIGLAMHNYHDAHGALPAAYSTDDEGNPLLSWRVHLLPYLEHQDLYDEFNLDEPWDSEHNIQLLERMPDLYMTWDDPFEVGKSTIVVPFGDGVMFEKPDEEQFGRHHPTGINLADVRDGTSNTIMLIVANSRGAVNWTEPADLDISADAFLDRIKGEDGGATTFVLADGSVQKFDVESALERIQAMLTRSGGELVGPDR